MKTLRFWILMGAVVVLVSGCATSHPQDGGSINHTPEDLAKRTIESFKRSDIALFVESAFTVNDAEAMVRTIQESFPRGSYPPPFQSGVESWDYEELFGKWAKVRLLGKVAGIDWAKVEFDHAKYKVEGAYGVRGCDIEAIFSVGDKHYSVLIDDCYHTGRGWLAADGPVWRGPIKQ